MDYLSIDTLSSLLSQSNQADILGKRVNYINVYNLEKFIKQQLRCIHYLLLDVSLVQKQKINLLQRIIVIISSIIQIMYNKEPYSESKSSHPTGQGQLKHLREVDINQIQKPKTLIILHYNGKRISVPLFQQIPNLAQLLYHHISKLEQTILNNQPSWQKKSNSQIICFQIKKDSKQTDSQVSKQSDLRSDILLSLLRIQSSFQGQQVEQLAFKIDITKVYKYLEIQPFFHFFDNDHSHHQDHHSHNALQIKQSSYFQFHRLLNSSRIHNIYLTRKVGNGHFYAIKVYATGCKGGTEQIRNVEQMQQIDIIRKDTETKCSLLCRSHQVAFIPNPDAQQEDQQEDQNSCKHISLVYPYFIKGSLQELLKEARYNRSRRIIQMDCLNYLKELMWGAHILHQKYNLIHRSIVPANLQIDQNNQLRLTNYFSCLPCYDSEGTPQTYVYKSIQKSFTYRSSFDLDQMFENEEYDVGEYTAPEVLKGQPYNYLVDFYSIGVIIKKLYEQSQIYEKVPISQNNQNLMMTMINKLTSSDLAERAAIIGQIIQDIQRQNSQGNQAGINLASINLQEIKVGKAIEIAESKKFIENDEVLNGIDHQTVINFFKQPSIKREQKAKPSIKKTVTKKLSKEKDKSSIKNSREKSEKCHSKNSQNLHQNSLTKTRKLSKKKNESFNSQNDQSNSSIHPKDSKVVKPKELNPKKKQLHDDSPKKKVSKSKSHEKKKKDDISVKLYTHQQEGKQKYPLCPSLIPKSPKNIPVRSKSPGISEKIKGKICL